MANVRVTSSNIKAKLQAWAAGTGITDTYIFHPSDGIDEKETINTAWQLAGLVITIDVYQNQFRKISFVEKLT